MTRVQAEQVIQGYMALCESRVLNWDWVDMADGPCRSFLFLNRDYCSGPCESNSCLGMSEFVNEGENLADYILFMKNAIDRPGEVNAEIDALKDRFLAEGDPNSQYEAAKELIKDPDCFPALQPAAAEEFARLLLSSAAGAGHKGAVNLASEKGWALDLNDLEFLSDATAEVLSKHKGDLYLECLKELSDTAAASLANHEGELLLGGLTKLSEAGAEALAKHPNLVVNEDLEAVIGKYRK